MLYVGWGVHVCCFVVRLVVYSTNEQNRATRSDKNELWDVESTDVEYLQMSRCAVKKIR